MASGLVLALICSDLLAYRIDLLLSLDKIYLACLLGA